MLSVPVNPAMSASSAPGSRNGHAVMCAADESTGDGCGIGDGDPIDGGAAMHNRIPSTIVNAATALANTTPTPISQCPASVGSSAAHAIGSHCASASFPA